MLKPFHILEQCCYEAGNDKCNSTRNCLAFLVEQLSLWPPRYFMSLISGFRCEVAENCTLVGYYAAINGNFSPTFICPILSVQEPKRKCCSLKYVFLLDSSILRLRPIGCPKTSVSNYHYLLHNNPEERSSLHSSCC